MGLHCSIRELQCIQYFKSVFLEILNVHIRSVFVNPVTNNIANAVLDISTKNKVTDYKNPGATV